MFYTVYKITNTVNGKIYIGVHKTSDLNDGYMGSGKLIKAAIEKYGIENFDREYLKVFDNPEDMFNMESELVNEEFVSRDDTYNLNLGGLGGWHVANSSGLNIYPGHSTQAKINLNVGREILSEKLLNDLEFRRDFADKVSSGLKEYIMTNGHWWKNKTHSDETRKKIGISNSISQKGNRNSQYGKMWIHSLELRKSMRISSAETIPIGWLKGRKMFNS